MRKILLGVVLVMAIAVIAAPAVMAQGLSALPPDLQEKIDDLMATRFPPELHAITFDPETPVAGEVTSVNVEIYNNSDVTDDETMEVYFLYSIDYGEEWEMIELETDDDQNWYGELPEFESETEIMYSVHAVDSSGNVYTEVPCITESVDVLTSKEYIMGDCVNAEEDCEENLLPRGCMMKMSMDEEIDDGDEVPAWADILDHRIGWDGTNAIIDQTFEDNFDQGTMNPIDLHAYASLILNADIAGEGTDMEVLLDAGGFLLSAPLAEMAGGMILPCVFGYNQGGELGQDGDSITCTDKKNHLIFTLDLSAPGENESGLYMFFSANGAITNFPDPIDGTAYDYTHVTTVRFTEDNILVVE